VIYKIMGKPIPWARPRIRFGSVNKFFDSQKKEKEDAIIQLKLQHKNKPIFDGPLNLVITFYMQAPLSLSYKKKCMLYGMPHFKRPDLSNMIKYTEDLLQNAQMLTDDSRIISIKAKKIYAEHPRTEFTITREGDDE